MKMQGYNGSQLWDTTFAVQAICATGMAAEFTNCLRKAQHYVDVTQASSRCPACLSAGNIGELHPQSFSVGTRWTGMPVKEAAFLVMSPVCMPICVSTDIVA